MTFDEITIHGRGPWASAVGGGWIMYHADDRGALVDVHHGVHVYGNGKIHLFLSADRMVGLEIDTLDRRHEDEDEFSVREEARGR